MIHIWICQFDAEYHIQTHDARCLAAHTHTNTHLRSFRRFDVGAALSVSQSLALCHVHFSCMHEIPFCSITEGYRVSRMMCTVVVHSLWNVFDGEVAKNRNSVILHTKTLDAFATTTTTRMMMMLLTSDLLTTIYLHTHVCCTCSPSFPLFALFIFIISFLRLPRLYWCAGSAVAAAADGRWLWPLIRISLYKWMALLLQTIYTHIQSHTASKLPEYFILVVFNGFRWMMLWRCDDGIAFHFTSLIINFY